MTELIGTLGSDDTQHVTFAVEELGDRNDPQAVEPLLRLLERTPVTPAYTDLLICTANSLGRLKDTRGTKPLVKLARDCDHHTEPITTAALNALAQIGDSSAVPDLQELFITLRVHRDSVSRALAASGGEAMAEYLRSHLDHEDEDVRAAATDGLALFSALAPIADLTRMADDENRKVRHAALSALVEFKVEGALDRYEEFMDEAIGWSEKYPLVLRWHGGGHEYVVPLMMRKSEQSHWHEGSDALRILTLQAAADNGEHSALEAIRGVRAIEATPGELALVDAEKTAAGDLEAAERLSEFAITRHVWHRYPSDSAKRFGEMQMVCLDALHKHQSNADEWSLVVLDALDTLASSTTWPEPRRRKARAILMDLLQVRTHREYLAWRDDD